MPNKQTDQKNQKQPPAAQPGKSGQSEGKSGIMPTKPSNQPHGARLGQEDVGDKNRQAGQTTGRKPNDAAPSGDKSGSGSKSPGRDNISREPKPNQSPQTTNPGNKKARIEGGTDEDQDRDETGKPTGMMEDTRITSSIDDEDMDRSGKPTDEVQRSDRNKNANGGSNKPR